MERRPFECRDSAAGMSRSADSAGTITAEDHCIWQIVIVHSQWDYRIELVSEEP